MKKILVFLAVINLFLAPAYPVLIEDEFIESTLDKNLKIKKQNKTVINDEFAESNKNKNLPKKAVKYEEVLPDNPIQRYNKKPVIFDENYKEVLIKIKNPYSTKDNLDEGDNIEFEILEDVVIKNQIYPKGSLVKARLETKSLNKSYGVPSDIVVGNFTLDNITLAGEISKSGANRTLWLRPLVYIGSFFFGAGLLFIPIRGGHAKIKPNEQFVLYAIE